MENLPVRPSCGGKVLMMGRFPLVQRVADAETSAHYSVYEQSLPPRGLVMPHSHRRHDQLKVVLVGTCGMYEDGEEFLAPTGTVVFGRRGVTHTVWNAGDDECKFLELTSPGDFEQYFFRFSKLPTGAALNLQHRVALADDFGITVFPDIARQLISRHGLAL